MHAGHLKFGCLRVRAEMLFDVHARGPKGFWMFGSAGRGKVGFLRAAQ